MTCAVPTFLLCVLLGATAAACPVPDPDVIGGGVTTAVLVETPLEAPIEKGVDIVSCEEPTPVPERRGRPAPGCKTPPVPFPRDVEAEPVFVTHDLTSNRHHGLPSGTLQIVTFYDGDRACLPTLRFGYRDQRTDGAGWITLQDLPASSHMSPNGRVGSWEFQLNGAVLDGRVEVSGIVPNGVIDGVAFGLSWRDERGRFHRFQSVSPTPRANAAYVGTWPVGMSDRQFARQARHITNDIARRHAQTMIYGAEYLDNGAYEMTFRPMRRKRQADCR